MDASSGYNHKHKWFAVNSASLNGNIAMSNGHNKPPQFWLNHQVSQQVSIPHKSLICPLVQWKLGEVWFGLCEMVLPLMTVREVIAMRVVESWGSKYTLNHTQILLVGSILGICSKEMNIEEIHRELEYFETCFTSLSCCFFRNSNY